MSPESFDDEHIRGLNPPASPEPPTPEPPPFDEPTMAIIERFLEGMRDPRDLASVVPFTTIETTKDHLRDRAYVLVHDLLRHLKLEQGERSC
jgi:hypothetical protein